MILIRLSLVHPNAKIYGSLVTRYTFYLLTWTVVKSILKRVYGCDLNCGQCSVLSCRGQTVNHWIVRLDFLREVTLKSEVFWSATPCRIVNNYRLYEGSKCLHLQG